MTTASTCTARTVTVEGAVYERIPFGDEFLEGDGPWDKPCGAILPNGEVCGARLGDRHHEDCSLGRGAIAARPSRCRDCGIAWSGIHHSGCGIERCPRCGHQFASCPCEGDALPEPPRERAQ